MVEHARLRQLAASKHSARVLANKIIEYAKRSDASLIELTEAGYGAAMQLAPSAQSIGKNLVRS